MPRLNGLSDDKIKDEINDIADDSYLLENILEDDLSEDDSGRNAIGNEQQNFALNENEISQNNQINNLETGNEQLEKETSEYS